MNLHNEYELILNGLASLEFHYKVEATIGVLTIIVLAITAGIFFRQLRAMKNQLIDLSGTSTQESLKELYKLALQDTDIQEIWRSEYPDLSSEEFKRDIFIRLHLEHMSHLFESGRVTKDKIMDVLNDHFKNKY